MIKTYDEFIKDEYENLKYRFDRCLKGGDFDCSFFSYLIETNFFENFDVVSKIKEKKDSIDYLINFVDNMSDNYIEWCKKKGDDYERDYGALKRNFKGSFGELFAYYTLNYNCGVVVYSKPGEDYDSVLYDFSDVFPDPYEDFGVDFIGNSYVKNKKTRCAIQVKFWNPYSEESKKAITLSYIQGVFGQACAENHIEQSDEKNVIFFTTLFEKCIFEKIKKNKLIEKHVLIIGKESLQLRLGSNIKFWEDFKKFVLTINSK